MRVSLLIFIFSFLMFSMFAWRTENTDRNHNNAAIEETAFVKIIPLSEDELKNYPLQTITYETVAKLKEKKKLKRISITTELSFEAPPLNIKKPTDNTCSESSDQRKFNRFFDIQ